MEQPTLQNALPQILIDTPIMASLYGFIKRLYLVRVLSSNNSASRMYTVQYRQYFANLFTVLVPSRTGSAHRVPLAIRYPRRGGHRTYRAHLSGQEPP